MEKQASCILCQVTTYQNEVGQTSCKPCNTSTSIGMTSLTPGSTKCSACIADEYFHDTATNKCVYRGLPCQPTHYEMTPDTANRTCTKLTECDTSMNPDIQSLSINMPALQVISFFTRLVLLMAGFMC